MAKKAGSKGAPSIGKGGFLNFRASRGAVQRLMQRSQRAAASVPF
jgi:hypothetical protein